MSERKLPGRLLKRWQINSLVLGFLATASTSCFGANPFVTSIYTADPSARVWPDGRLYVYPSRDIDPPKGCDRMDKYHAFSTDDMVHWRDEGQILQASQVKWGRPEGGFMWAPDCAYKNGTYYFYFPHPSGTQWNDTWRVGVATSSKPASDFVPAAEPMKGLEGHAMIDPAVFTDTDGKTYIYFGGGGKCEGGLLKDNMVELDGVMQPMQGLVDFHEATWVFKRNGIYYLTYADNHRDQNRLQYAIGSSPLGPWTSKGVFLDGTGSGTNHGSVVLYKDHWYAFYHNQAISGQGNLRSICVDALKFNDDGTMQKVIQTKEGVAALPSTPDALLPSSAYAIDAAVLKGGAVIEKETAADEGSCIRGLQAAGASCEFTAIDGGAGGRCMLSVRYACNAHKMKLALGINGIDESFINTPSTGGKSAFTGMATFTAPFKAGKTNTITLTGGNGDVAIAGISVTPLGDH